MLVTQKACESALSKPQGTSISALACQVTEAAENKGYHTHRNRLFRAVHSQKNITQSPVSILNPVALALTLTHVMSP